MPHAPSRLATFWPMRPTPMMPMVLPSISVPRFSSSFQPPLRMNASLNLSRLNSATIRPMVASATPM